MSTIVQATCPGCKKVLRIPADWLRETFRCKHCHTVIQGRPSAAPRPATPLPATHTARKAAPERTSKIPLPVAKVAAPVAAVPPPPPVPVGVKVAPLAVPVAAAPRAPLAVPVAGVAHDPFKGIDDAAASSAPLPRRRRGGRGWSGYIVGLVVLGIAGGSIFAFWPQLAPLFDKKPSDTKQEARADPEKSKPASPVKHNTPRPDPVEDPPVKKPPVKKPPVKRPPTTDRDPTKRPPIRKPPVVAGAFPRRALIISVHNYLYANPISFGDYGQGRRNFHTFLGRLPQLKGFHISPPQIVHLSDAARKNPHPPVKSVIENTLTNFLKESRPGSPAGAVCRPRRGDRRRSLPRAH